MAIDLIKEYLVGIGFKVDDDSFDKTEKSIDQAGEKIKDFNKDSTEGFTETNSSLKDLFSILSSSDAFTKLFPDTQGPLTELIGKLTLLKKVYKEIGEVNIKNDIPKAEVKHKPKVKENTEGNKALGVIKDNIGIEEINGASKKLSGNLAGLKETSKSLLTEGGGAIKKFAAAAKHPISILVISVVGAVIAIKKLSKSLGELANKEIGYEKLSRQLWTTKENAKEIDSALKTLDATMDDLWLSPTLLKQFNQLRKDMREMRLPSEFKDNIKVIQGMGLEFKRLKQIGSMFLQLIGNSILEQIAGPLDEVRQGFRSFNDWLVEHIPKIAKVIGTIIGVLLRVLMVVGKVIGLLWKITSPIRFVLGLIGKLFDAFDSIPGPIKSVLKLIGMIALAILAGPVGAILLVIALIDDLFTFIRGGDSVIGDLWEGFKNWGSNAIASVKEGFSEFASFIKEGMNSLSESWNDYWDKAAETFENIREKAKEVWSDIKDWASEKWEGVKETVKGWLPDAKENVLNLDEQMQDGSNSAATKSYMTNDNSSSINTNSTENNVSSVNNINVYGSNAEATGKAVERNLTGIQTRNVQGVL